MKKAIPSEAQLRSVQELDARFRAEVEQGLREADDPTVERIPHEEVSANWRRQRAELLKRAGKRTE
ncbi:MAG TPA: hypothetical protein VK597_13405 [Inquilinus sp.]|nr:hypothetical protein [Inquilinus sp.]